MKLPDHPIAKKELQNEIDRFIREDCEKKGGNFIHKNCGGGIRGAFISCFFADKNGEIDIGDDGFGWRLIKVPYCEKCDPPDGPYFTYTQRVFIKKD